MNISVAAAQIPAFSGNVKGNLENHLHAAVQAAEHGISFLQFPELSLTGYELELLSRLAVSPYSSELDLLQKTAEIKQMTLSVGLPLKIRRKIYIGNLIFTPDGERLVYTKIYLHSGEAQYVCAGRDYVTFSCGIGSCQTRIGLSVCADMIHRDHAAAYGSYIDLYSAGVFITPEGYDSDSKKMASYAEEFGFIALMANYTGNSGGWQSGGGSAGWSPEGLLVQAPSSGDYLTIFKKSHESSWSGILYPLDLPVVPQRCDSSAYRIGSFLK